MRVEPSNRVTQRQFVPGRFQEVARHSNGAHLVEGSDNGVSWGDSLCAADREPVGNGQERCQPHAADEVQLFVLPVWRLGYAVSSWSVCGQDKQSRRINE